MIIVSGTKRSGTSLWMQLLRAAGLPIIGSAFPANWKETIGDANPRGFWESRLTGGVYFRTNPDPRSGEFLFPDQVERHALKIFVPGLLRTDYAYIGQVIVSVRPWREFCASLRQLQATAQEAQDLDDSRRVAPDLHPAFEWWAENYAAIRDAATRRYPVHFQTHGGLLRDPEGVAHRVLEWLGGELNPSAHEVVNPELHRQREASADPGQIEAASGGHGLDDEDIAVFDELYATLDSGADLTGAFVERLNATQERLRPHFVAHEARVHAETIRHLTGPRVDLP